MDPVRRLYLLWNWLPAFRAVAETEHLPTASAQLGISPQALSHAVKQLEAAAGIDLFVRTGRRIRLSAEGATFLSRVRDAMRTLDEGVQEFSEASLVGPGRIAALAHHALIFAKPAIEALRRAHPRVVPHLVAVSGEEAERELKRGRIDVLVSDTPSDDPALAVEHLSTLRSSIFCGASHELFRRRALTLDEVLEHPFVGPEGGISDGWPPELDRRIGARTGSFQLAVELCHSGSFLGFFPSALRRERFRRFDLEHSSERPVYLVYRRPISTHRLTDALIASLREATDLTQRQEKTLVLK